MKKEESRDSLIDIPAEDDRDESQLTGRKAAEYNKQHVIRHRNVSARRYYVRWEYCWHFLQSLR